MIIVVSPDQVPLQEQAAAGYREQDNALNMRDPPKAPPLKLSMREKQEVGVAGSQVAKSYNNTGAVFCRLFVLDRIKFKFSTNIVKCSFIGLFK